MFCNLFFTFAERKRHAARNSRNGYNARCDGLRVSVEPIGAISVLPASFFVQRKGKIPMKERCVRRDALFQQFVRQTVVKVQPLFVNCARTFGKHPRPGNRKR